MKLSVLASLAAFLVNAGMIKAVAIYGQCGGIGWTGSTACDSGTTCTVVNTYYFQCLPGTAATTTKAAATTTSTTKATTPSSTTTGSGPTATGYVKTSGQKFTLNGSTYIVVGTNAYWLAQLSTTAVIDAAFADMAAAGATTVRTWGFNDVTSPSGTYYQLWSNGVGTLNTGSSGLAKFDTVVASAKSHGLRLIVALTNNWSDYGGMDVYVSQIVGSGQPHDLFYTNTAVKTAFKKYIAGFVGRYINEPTILGWELANEPRCKGSSSTASSSCTTTTITAWAKEISAYIKSIDSNHLVGLGDEGFFNQPSNPSYPYQGSEGIDFAANLAISTLDFGTFHSYPAGWGVTTDLTTWGSTWISDHAATQKSVGKPVIIEEYGVTSAQDTTYKAWLATVVSSGLTGELYWQAGSHLSTGDTSQDGYALYPDSAAYPVVKAGAASIKARG